MKAQIENMEAIRRTTERGTPGTKGEIKRISKGGIPQSSPPLIKIMRRYMSPYGTTIFFYVPIPFGEISRNEIRVHIASSTEGTDMI